jgi:hypothetical protein
LAIGSQRSWEAVVGNGLILGYLMYRSGLVPQVIATVPEFSWELSLGVYLIVEGFKPSPILSGDASPVLQTSSSPGNDQSSMDRRLGEFKVPPRTL